MKLNNKGFALTSIIYMLIVLFLMIMLLILANLAQRKVVLDKIKNDVKNELNQGGVVASSNMIVTFDPTIGQINQTSKQVTYNEPYGELPTPTREGYRFVGWRGKNLAPEINNENYIVWHYNDRTTSELKSENGENFIRINGNPSTENIDTLWKIYNKKKIELNQGEYILSFDVRSQNSGLMQYIKKRENRQDGNTGIYVNETTNIDNMISSIESDYNFDNDGEWHHFTSKVTIPYDTKDALILISNDIPNIYGTNSYIDIKNIQLEPGDTATSYEPYLGNITSDTIVTKQENHTLYAMWKPLYTVTFDPDGGTLSETTKEVTYNEPYGQLPTPTKEGYTFMGWNGKNMFDEESILMAITDATYENNHYNFTLANAHLKYYYNNQSFPIYNLNDNIQYTISLYGYVDEFNTPGNRLSIDCLYNQDTSPTRILSLNDTTESYHSAIFDTGLKKIKMSFGYGGSTYAHISHIQLEEGTIATEYEPYYITPTTKVVQENDHTLKAIWKANE